MTKKAHNMPEDNVVYFVKAYHNNQTHYVELGVFDSLNKAEHFAENYWINYNANPCDYNPKDVSKPLIFIESFCLNKRMKAIEVWDFGQNEINLRNTGFGHTFQWTTRLP